MASSLHTPAQYSARAVTAQYIVALYRHARSLESLDPSKERPLPPAAPSTISDELKVECDAIATTILQATKNKYKLDWDAVRYTARRGADTPLKIQHENELLLQYSPLVDPQIIIAGDAHYGLVADPAVFVDRHGNIMAWSFPRMLSEHRQTSVLEAMRLAEGHLTTADDPDDPNPGQKWRTSKRFFTDGREWKAGTMSFSPAWFPQGRKGGTHRPVNSPFVRSVKGVEWMRAMEEVGGLLDGILAVTHPRLYRIALAFLPELSQKLPELRDGISRWPFCFNAAQIIANRMSIYHLDTAGRAGWPDLLLTLGTYGERAVVEFRNLGATVPYDAGSIVMVASRTVVHAVPAVPADRISLACIMLDSLHEWMNVPDPGFATITELLSL